MGVIDWLKKRAANYNKRSLERFLAGENRKRNAAQAFLNNQRRRANNLRRRQEAARAAMAGRANNLRRRQAAARAAMTQNNRNLINFKSSLRLRPGETPLNHQLRLSHTIIPFNRGTNQYDAARVILKKQKQNNRQPRYNASGVLHI
jgi:hypothetical protein